MDLSPIEILMIVAILGPVAAAIAMVANGIIKQRKLDRMLRLTEELRRMKLPEGAAYIITQGTNREISERLIGYFMLVAVGGFGLNQLQRLLILLYQCGLESLVGSILLVENDSQQRARFYYLMPQCYRDRVKFGYSDSYGGGKGNEPIERSIDNVDIWGVPIEKAAEETIDVHLRRNGGRAPGTIFFFQSLGGQAADGLPVMEPIHERFEETQIVGFPCFPKHEVLRERFQALKARYEELGVIGWVSEDGLNADPVTSDYGMIALIVGLADAALYSDAPTQPNNAFRLALGEQPGSILAYQVVARSVVGFPFRPHPIMRQRYYVFLQSVVEEMLRSLRRIEENRGLWSIDLAVGEERAVIFDVVMTSVDHNDLKQAEDNVKRGRILRAKFAKPNGSSTSGNGHSPGNLFGQPNYETPFARLATVIDSEKPICPVVVVRLAVLRTAPNLVDEIIKVPAKRTLPGVSHHLSDRNGKRPASPVKQLTQTSSEEPTSKRPKKGETG